MKSLLTVTFLNGKTKRFYYDLDDEKETLQRAKLKSFLERSSLVLRIQDENLEHDDELMIIPTSSIESIRLSLPMKEMNFPEVLPVSRVE